MIETTANEAATNERATTETTINRKTHLEKRVNKTREPKLLLLMRLWGLMKRGYIVTQIDLWY